MKTDKAMKKKKLAIDGINQAIDNFNEVQTFTTINQLNHFKEKLMNCEHLIQLNNIPDKSHRNLGISRIIIDQWPFDSELGCMIINAESEYKSL